MNGSAASSSPFALRVTAQLGIVIAPLAALANALFLDDQLPARMAGLGAIFVLALLGRVSLLWRLARRRIEAVTVVYMTLISWSLLYLLSLSPQSLGLLVAPMSALLVAAPMIYPLGIAHQSVLLGATLVAFWGAFWELTPTPSGESVFHVGVALSSLSVISLLAAWLLESHRKAAFLERARMRSLAVQRHRLIEIGRELRSTLDLDVILPRLVEHAGHILPADQLAMVCRDTEGVEFRVAAGAGATSRTSPPPRIRC